MTPLAPGTACVPLSVAPGTPSSPAGRSSALVSPLVAAPLPAGELPADVPPALVEPALDAATPGFEGWDASEAFDPCEAELEQAVSANVAAATVIRAGTVGRAVMRLLGRDGVRPGDHITGLAAAARATVAQPDAVT
jgi:hypothetical protein